MRCRLCTSEAKIVVSHIIPEFLYETLYDEKHRFFELSLEPGRPDKFKQIGLREPLLCEPCEQQLSVYEGYFRHLLQSRTAVTCVSDGEHLRLSGLDYANIKLFQLSILWRAGVSTLPEFAQVELGPHEARIRQMLCLREPGANSDYGCIMSAVLHEHELLQGVVVPPTHARVLGHKAYRFVFGGLAFIYVVTSSALPSYVTQAFCQTEGTAVLRKQQVAKMGFLMDAFHELKRQGKLGTSQ